MKCSIRIALALLLALALFTPANAQDPPKPPTPPEQSNVPATPAPPPLNPEEEDAYKKLYEHPKDDNEGLIRAAEEFAKKFPESRYLASVYGKLVNAYLAAQQIEKLFDAGEKALALNPDNVDVLPIMAWVVPRRIDPNALDAQQKLEKAEAYGKRGMELLEAMEKPAEIAEEQFDQAKKEKLAMCHSGLGLVHLHRQKFGDAATELEQATKLSSNPEPTDFFLLGLAYEQTQRFGEAAGAYERCSSTPWAWQDRCKQGQDRTKKLAAGQKP